MPPHDAAPTVEDQLADCRRLLGEILARLDAGSPPAPSRAAYSVEEAAALLGRKPYTVREWCRDGRIHAFKRRERSGASELWAVPADEIRRVRDEGLLPPDRARNLGRRSQ